MTFNPNHYIHQIFAPNLANFDELAIQAFLYQFEHNLIYRKYCELIGIYNPLDVKKITQIPFLPISFFKTHTIASKPITNNTKVFLSSSTTQTGISKHYLVDSSIYKKSIDYHFNQTFGNVKNFAILALLPGYLERNNSSLVFMVNYLMLQSNRPENGFYLNDFENLYKAISDLEDRKQPYIIFGVTHALLDFANQYKANLKHGRIIETGGMKGRKKEMVRAELYAILQKAFGLNQIYSEYGMTELLSMAYSYNLGKYHPTQTLKVLISEINDPFCWAPEGRNGVVNVIDLANIYTCSFIQTADLGVTNSDNTFEILGRLDNSDIRGCSLMVV
jgi:hypothetical protein